MTLEIVHGRRNMAVRKITVFRRLTKTVLQALDR